jgi:hypothetical protein
MQTQFINEGMCEVTVALMGRAKQQRFRVSERREHISGVLGGTLQKRRYNSFCSYIKNLAVGILKNINLYFTKQRRSM